MAFSIGTVCVACFLLFLTCITLALRREPPPVWLLALSISLLAVSAVGGCLSAQLFTAKHQAIAGRGRAVPLFFGLARLITWEQNEGVILLRDKRISETIYGPKSGGGLRILYPVFGEELRARVPLTVQLTWFRDERVLTRESIQLAVKVALWWEVSDLGAYFYRIDQEVHSLRDRDRPGEGVAAVARPTARGQLGIAEVWVQTLAESCLRKLIADTSTFLIVSKRAASHLHHGAGESFEPEDLQAATPDVIAEKLKAELLPRLTGYGLNIDRVEIQEVQLPVQIQQAVDDVWTASTLPTKSRHEAQALGNRLEVLCRLLGKEAAGVSEIMGKLPAGAFMGNPVTWLPALMEQLAAGAKPPSRSSVPLAPSPPTPPGPPSPTGP